MMFAIPTVSPSLWRNPIYRNSHCTYCTAKSVSVELDNESKSNKLTFSTNGISKTPKYTKWTPQFALVEELLNILRSSENIQSALDSWDKPLSPKNIVTILNNLNNWEKGLNFLEWVKSREDTYEVNRYTYNVMLKILRDGRQFELCEKIFNEMVERGIDPDNYTYSTLINCAKRCRRPEEALKWFEKMKSAGIVPDEVTYNSIIDMYGRVGRANEAVELYEKLRSVHWKLDTITYGALANVYAKTGDYRAIEQLINEMKDAGLAPNEFMMNTLITALSKSGKVNQAKKVFTEMIKNELNPSPVTLSILIEMYTRVGSYEQAFEIFDTIKKEDWSCDVAVYNSLMKACVEAGKVKEGENILKEMERAKCNPDHLTYRILMNTYASKGLVEQANKMFQHVVKLRGKPDTQLYTVLIRAHKQAGKLKQIPKLFESMIDEGCIPDELLGGVLLSCVAAASDVDDRCHILPCLQKCNEKLYSVVSSIVSSNPDVEMIEDYVLEIVPQKPICNALIDICWSTGRKHVTHRVFTMGVSVGVYEGLQTNMPSLWRLNLRTLSLPAAECAIEAWFNTLTVAVKEQEQLPEDLIIETGVGRVRTGQRLNSSVGNLLKKMEAPFTESNETPGFYFSTGPVIESWIKAKYS